MIICTARDSGPIGLLPVRLVPVIEGRCIWIMITAVCRNFRQLSKVSTISLATVFGWKESGVHGTCRKFGSDRTTDEHNIDFTRSDCLREGQIR